ncbi:MAG: PqqD family protein [Candidatus Omnitrophota bacterium]
MKNRVYKKNPNFVARKIADEIILVPIKKEAADFEAIYNLNNEVSVRIWELIDGKRTLAEIRKKILDEFEVEPEKLVEDLKEFIADLREVGAIQKKEKKMLC